MKRGKWNPKATSMIVLQRPEGKSPSDIYTEH